MKKTETITTINGVPLTERMLEELQVWDIGGGSASYPIYFIRVLTSLQDYFCSQFRCFGQDDTKQYKETVQYLEDIILMKEALAPFAEYVAKDNDK